MITTLIGHTPCHADELPLFGHYFFADYQNGFYEKRWSINQPLAGRHAGI